MILQKARKVEDRGVTVTVEKVGAQLKVRLPNGSSRLVDRGCVAHTAKRARKGNLNENTQDAASCSKPSVSDVGKDVVIGDLPAPDEGGGSLFDEDELADFD